MYDLLNFMGENSVLSIVLVVIIGVSLVRVFKYIAYAIKGKPYLCEECGREEDDEDSNY